MSAIAWSTYCNLLVNHHVKVKGTREANSKPVFVVGETKNARRNSRLFGCPIWKTCMEAGVLIVIPGHGPLVMKKSFARSWRTTWQRQTPTVQINLRFRRLLRGRELLDNKPKAGSWGLSKPLPAAVTQYFLLLTAIQKLYWTSIEHTINYVTRIELRTLLCLL